MVLSGAELAPELTSWLSGCKREWQEEEGQRKVLSRSVKCGKPFLAVKFCGGSAGGVCSINVCPSPDEHEQHVNGIDQVRRIHLGSLLSSGFQMLVLFLSCCFIGTLLHHSFSV